MVIRQMMVVTGLALVTAPLAEVVGQSDSEVLPELTVAISQNSCPLTPSAEARALISRASGGRAESVAGAVIDVVAQRIVRDVPVQNVGKQPVPPEVDAVESGSTAFGRAAWIERLETGTFALPLSVSSLSGVFEAWEYPEFWGRLGYYFFTEDFRSSHEFGFISGDEEIVGFCARRRDDSYIDGRILLDDTGSISGVDWAFTTPGPQESAGGRAVFDPDQVPLPTNGLFWRRRAGGDYTEWANEFQSWSVRRAS